MAPSLEAMNGSKGVESDPRIQTLTAEQKQALFGMLIAGKGLAPALVDYSLGSQV